MADLGRWLGGEYRLPGADRATDPGPESLADADDAPDERKD